MNNILDKVDAVSLRDDIPEFRPGDTVNVGVKVIEGSPLVFSTSRASLSVAKTVASVRPSPSAR